MLRALSACCLALLAAWTPAAQDPAVGDGTGRTAVEAAFPGDALVLAPDGEPLVGARVAVLQQPDRSSREGEDLVLEVVETDADVRAGQTTRVDLR